MTTEQHHMRLDSGVSTASSSDYGDGVFVSSRYWFQVHPNTHIGTACPSFGFQPTPFFSSDDPVDASSPNLSRYSDSPPPSKTVGLLDPKNNTLHHGLVFSLGLLLVLVGWNLC
jgi:hypothetical protein